MIYERVITRIVVDRYQIGKLDIIFVSPYHIAIFWQGPKIESLLLIFNRPMVPRLSASRPGITVSLMLRG